MSHIVFLRTYNSRKVARQAWRRAKLGDDYVVCPDGNGKWKIVSIRPNQMAPEAREALARAIAKLMVVIIEKRILASSAGRRRKTRKG